MVQGLETLKPEPQTLNPGTLNPKPLLLQSKTFRFGQYDRPFKALHKPIKRTLSTPL